MLSIAFYSYMFWMIGYCDTSVHFEVVRTQGLQLVMSSWSFKHLCRLQVVCLILFCGTFCVALGAGKALTFEQEDMPTLRMRSAGRLFLPGSLTPMFTLQWVLSTSPWPHIIDRIAARVLKADEKFDPIP